MKKILYICICIIYLLFLSCLPAKVHIKKKIVYKVFDSLDIYLCNMSELKKRSGIVIRHIGNTHSLYEIKIYNRIYEYKGRYKEVFKNSNRYLYVCGKLYPVFIENVDDYFVDPIDSLSLYYYSIYGRAYRFHLLPGVMADLNKSEYYLEFDSDSSSQFEYGGYDIKKPRGKRIYKSDTTRK